MNDFHCGKITEQDKELVEKWNLIQRERSMSKRGRGKASVEKVELFHTETYVRVSPNTPSQFMIDYIEATYNLFQIQQKRIEELENVIAELNAKIE